MDDAKQGDDMVFQKKAEMAQLHNYKKSITGKGQLAQFMTASIDTHLLKKKDALGSMAPVSET